MVDLATSTVDEVCTEIMQGGWEVNYPSQPFTLNITGTTIFVENQAGDSVTLDDSWPKTGSVKKVRFSLSESEPNYANWIKTGVLQEDGAKSWDGVNSRACDSAYTFFANRIADRYLGMVSALSRQGAASQAQIDKLEYKVLSAPSDPIYKSIIFRLTFHVEQRGTDTVTGDAISLVEGGTRTIQIEGNIGDPGALEGQTKIGEMRLTDKMGSNEDDSIEIGEYEDRVLNFPMGNNPAVLAIITKFARAIQQLKAQWEAKPDQPPEGKK